MASEQNTARKAAPVARPRKRPQALRVRKARWRPEIGRRRCSTQKSDLVAANIKPEHRDIAFAAPKDEKAETHGTNAGIIRAEW